MPCSSFQSDIHMWGYFSLAFEVLKGLYCFAYPLKPCSHFGSGEINWFNIFFSLDDVISELLAYLALVQTEACLLF